MRLHARHLTIGALVATALSRGAAQEKAMPIAARAESLSLRFSTDRSNRALLQHSLAAADSALRLDSTLVQAHAARANAYAS